LHSPLSLSLFLTDPRFPTVPKMHLTRLSRIETVPSELDTPLQRPMSKLPSRIPSVLLLAITSALILVSLLLPNQYTRLSAMTIKPVNKQYAPATMVHGASTPTPMPTGVWGMNETDEPGRSEQEAKPPVGPVTWFGIMGPEIWVGAMRESNLRARLTIEICSRSDRDAEVVCTASSRPTFRESHSRTS
jgi:hypothetical protein